MTNLLNRLSERKITKIYCIDDENAGPAISTLDDVVDALATLSPTKLDAVARRDHRFADIVEHRRALGKVEREELRAVLRPAVADLVDNLQMSSSDFQGIAEIRNQGHIGETAKKFKVPFKGALIHALSFAEWRSRAVEIIGSASSEARVLLLIDELNDHEPDVDLNGAKLLAELWSNYGESVAFFDLVVVTSNCQPNDEIKEAAEVLCAVRANISDPQKAQAVQRTFVLSKARLSKTPLERELVIHIDRISATQLRGELTDIAKTLLREAVDESIKFLEEIPLAAFQGSVFASSENEGSAEIDTLLRLASIHQRTRLEESLSTAPKLRKKIVEMRRFSLKALDEQLEEASQSQLRRLRTQEFERQGSQINPLMVAIASGDVFRMTLMKGKAPIVKDVMLLANPCDLVLRQNGKRKLNRGWLVEVTKDTKATIDTRAAAPNHRPPLAYVLNTGDKPEDIAYLFNNSNVESVDLGALDLCWSNSKGAAVFYAVDAAAAYDFVLPNQRKRLEILAERAEAGKFSNMELWGGMVEVQSQPIAATAVCGVTIERQQSYPIFRVWRLAPEFASAALLSLSHSIARPAFGHDFLRTE